MAAFKRRGSSRHYFTGKTGTGWKQIATGTTDRALARKIEAMWSALADQREWPLLAAVLGERITIGDLWDLYRATDGDTAEMRRRLNDADLGALLDDFAAVYRRERPDNVTRTVNRIRDGLLRDGALLRSQVSSALLTERLYAYPGRAGTLRGVHSAWSVFFQYLTDARGLFEVNPMLAVRRPPVTPKVIRFLELPDAERVVGSQPTAARRAFYAFAYGAGLETSATLGVMRSDLDPERHETRAPGTKTKRRDRIARVAEWAWPHIWAHARTLLPTARLFPAEWDERVVYRWHRTTLDLLSLPPVTLHAARDHWAVMRLRAGTPIAVVQAQLGHSTPTTTLTRYGAFIPQGADRDRWEQVTSADLERRREVR